MENKQLIAQLEHPSNFVTLVHLISQKNNLNPNHKTTVINIKAFLAPLKVDEIAKHSKSLDEANAIIVELFSQRQNDKRLQANIPDDLNKTKEFLTKVINLPGNSGGASSTKVTEDKTKSTFTNKEGFVDAAPSILDLTAKERFDTIRYLNYSSLFRDEYIYIDSRYRNIANTDPTKLSFILLTNTKEKTDHGGIVVGNPIRNIVEIEVFPFTIPYKPVYKTFYNKITLTIEEWASNAFEAYEGGQFHFGFNIDQIDNNLMYLSPTNSTYSFSSPVNYVDSFTLSFGAVLPKIKFDPDRLAPSHISYDEDGLITFATEHNCVTGDLVYITGFESPFMARDKTIIDEINRSSGHSVVKKNNFSIIINVNLDKLRIEDEDTGKYPIDTFEQKHCLFYFASKRVQIQMRLRYLTSY